MINQKEYCKEKSDLGFNLYNQMAKKKFVNSTNNSAGLADMNIVRDEYCGVDASGTSTINNEDYVFEFKTRARKYNYFPTLIIEEVKIQSFLEFLDNGFQGVYVSLIPIDEKETIFNQYSLLVNNNTLPMIRSKIFGLPTTDPAKDGEERNTLTYEVPKDKMIHRVVIKE